MKLSIFSFLYHLFAEALVVVWPEGRWPGWPPCVKVPNRRMKRDGEGSVILSRRSCQWTSPKSHSPPGPVVSHPAPGFEYLTGCFERRSGSLSGRNWKNPTKWKSAPPGWSEGRWRLCIVKSDPRSNSFGAHVRPSTNSEWILVVLAQRRKTNTSHTMQNSAPLEFHSHLPTSC